MCGVLGLNCEKDRSDLGAVASKLLRMLEYRGYDSTGAAIQNSKGEISLRKDVGSPTVVTEKLDIYGLKGRVFCGQVRWATFGTVTKENAQPHEVKCKTHIYGAHNGNITNCDQLKQWLTNEGHAVVSDNDGEMLVHMVEHFFAIELKKLSNINDPKARAEALKNATLNAFKKIVGSFAAVIIDPVTEIMVSIKAGSSLYMGQGHDEKGGSFIMVSSDLGAVLSQTKILLPMNENEFCIFGPKEYSFYNLTTGEHISKEPVRSKLKIEETKLNKPFEYFMEQEIYGQVETSRRVIGFYTGSNPVFNFIDEVEKKNQKLVEYVRETITKLSNNVNWDDFTEQCQKFFDSKEISEINSLIKKSNIGFADDKEKAIHSRFESTIGSFLDDMYNLDGYSKYYPELKFTDTLFMLDEVKDARNRAEKFVDILIDAKEHGHAIYCVACGTSYNAAKTAGIFFNNMAGMNISPMLPGDFRSQCSKSIQDGDILIGVSQSGETKDLIDIFNLVRDSGKKTINITILNNINSTLALEKSTLFIPLFCGAEIAVPATKSFINQLLVFYILALNTAEKLHGAEKIKKYRDYLDLVPDLISRTIETTKDDIDKVAGDLFLAPSLHILGTAMQGIAREGALKVREVVLNHTEGYEGAEFKHGPNTILGVNTIFGFDGIRALLMKFSELINFALQTPEGKDLNAKNIGKIYSAVSDYAFADKQPKGLDPVELKIFKTIFEKHNLFNSLYKNYPLIFVTGPYEKDVNLTISQINTHKIRGADIYVIAEENQNLRDAAFKVPVMCNKYDYRSGYIVLPKTDSNILAIFSSAVVLQLLALNMSIRKLTFLNKLEIENHGVHPDSPKNVSKSITVD
ncbi:MAG: SIS domain-containing protein [Proteobacteria bacterium]|nr:SIS domain-containing protein [Pseudomonadota bacterium]